MTERITSLQATPLPKQSRIAQSIRLPGQLICPDGIIMYDLERVVQRHLLLQTVPSLWDRAERYLVIHGEPGTAKSVTACDASLRFGWAVAHLPMAELSGESEGAATDALTSFLEEVVVWSKQAQMRVVIILDDADLSILSTDGKTGNTVNTALLTNELQRLADRPKPYRLHDSSVCPLIFTGNDYSKTRSSLFRHSRAKWHTHRLTLEEKVRLAFHLLAPKTRDELYLVEKLVRAYRAESAAFWSSLKADIQTAHLDQLISDGITEPAAIEAHLARPLVLDAEKIWDFAKARANNKPKSFL